ncbi:MAG: DUF2800 domain-containing protein [Peptococcaceae bacterium]|nr:DUF2800 domain-containing protein [Peptococcaceae bacterium]
MAAHALLSASSAARWLHCPPSVRLTEKLPDTASRYAAEGTLAHAMAEDMLRAFIAGKRWRLTKRFKNDPLFYEGMAEDVRPYVDYVEDAFAAAGKGAALDVEARLDFSEVVPQGFGTGDAVITAPGRLEIVDLKFGKGVVVDAEDNPQIMLYGLGALLAYDFIYDIGEIRMTIVQPRLDHVSSFAMSADALRRWSEDVVRPRAKLAYAGEGERAAGDWCRWCKIKASCRVRAQAMLAVADKRTRAQLTDTELSEILAQREAIKNWLTDVEGGVMDRLLRGESLAGWKLVEGRSNRKVCDADGLAEALTARYSADEIYKPRELKTITALEKLHGKKAFAEDFAAYIEKPPGKPTIAPESDKRPAIGTPETQFEFEDLQ